MTSAEAISIKGVDASKPAIVETPYKRGGRQQRGGDAVNEPPSK
jgi:hypothetical protein